MLVLKRRREQSVRIGPDVVVKIIAIQSGAVTLAITLERDGTVLIDRDVMVKVLRVAEDDGWTHLGVMAPPEMKIPREPPQSAA
jgi:sRNA-binding carbon storage regulator CsrA